MKKFYGFYPILFMMMILLITGSAGAFIIGDGKGIYGVDRQPGIKANDLFLKAFTTLRDREAVPEGLTKTGWGKISASIEQDRYRLQKDDRSGEYQAFNNAHDIHATFTREGFEVSPRKREKGWNWGLSLSRYGYGSDLHAVPEAKKMITRDNRIEYHRGDMVEWYINDHRGLEQGFTLKARPSGWLGSGLLQLQMRATGNLLPEVEKEEKGIVWRDGHGKEVLRYSGLYAYDAAGKVLDARIAADQEGIRLIVEDHEAVYPITIDPFIESKKLLASDGAAEDQFGFSVSISGDTAIVGAYYDQDNGYGSGSAYIFSRDEGGADNWGEVKKLTASDGALNDRFGYSVSISGDTAIVGAYLAGNLGATYIFSRDQGGADNWGEVKKLTAGDGTLNDFFGNSVSISGDTAIVGAFFDHDNGVNSGSAYIFSRDEGGADNWGEVKKITASDGALNDNFGVSVSISGDTAIVGIRQDADAGAAYIFSRDQGGADNWGEVKKLTASDGALYDRFGYSVSISGDTAIVGAHSDDDNGLYSGSAYIFSRDEGGADNWGEVQKITASDGAGWEWFGNSVSISGDTAIVGAFSDDDNGRFSGSAYIFRPTLVTVYPINHDFGIVTIDCTPTQAFTTTNEQDENLQLGTFSITGLDSAEFLIQNDTCSGQTLAPDGSCTFDVLFDPDSLGSKNAAVSIPFTEPGIDALEVPLSGLVTEVCEGEFDNDGDVDGSDLAVFAADFGRTDCGTGEPCEGDFDDDNDVDGSDLAVFAADFGRTDCPDCPTSD